ncbi:MAG TPA: hypothetical protein EYP68_06045 [Candidatus Korarchaeota archaeon]|nr:hypothetical protein [Candidatus Korarchaeota archaeon]
MGQIDWELNLLSLIPFHAKLDEVEPLIYEASSAIHLGIGESVVEAVWSMNFFEEITFTDIDEKKLGVLAGFLKKSFPKTQLMTQIEPNDSDLRIEHVLRVLTDTRRSLGLRRLRTRFRTKRINLRPLDILDLKGFNEKFDFAFFFGFTTAFEKALETGHSLLLPISNIKRLLKKSGIAILSDFLPKEDVIMRLDDLGIERVGIYTFCIRG